MTWCFYTIAYIQYALLIVTESNSHFEFLVFSSGLVPIMFSLGHRSNSWVGVPLSFCSPFYKGMHLFNDTTWDNGLQCVNNTNMVSLIWQSHDLERRVSNTSSLPQTANGSNRCFSIVKSGGPTSLTSSIWTDLKTQDIQYECNSLRIEMISLQLLALYRQSRGTFLSWLV
jgi:hypothetical protein